MNEKVDTNYFDLTIQKQYKNRKWPGRDLNTQPSDLESDALPSRHQAMLREEY